jgi:hypothetical protein
MYYETNQVNEILLCQHCQAQLEGPKILPCGETICSYCVSSIKSNVFDCLVCKQKHEMPKNGLPDNKALLKMLSVQPNRVSRGKSNESLMKLLEDQIVIKSATNLIKTSDQEILILKDAILDGKIFKFEKNSDIINKSILGVTKVIYTKLDSIILSSLDQINSLHYLIFKYLKNSI